MTNPSGRLCPICKNENEEEASVCRHCGARLEDTQTRLVSVPETPEAKIKSVINAELIPAEGVGIHIAGEIKPLYVAFPKELVIGRATETATTTETLLDLTDFNAGSMGVSRRHIMLRRTPSGYDAIDLFSSNGTWLNAERLVPNKAYPFASGSQFRIGTMRLLVMYLPKVKKPK